MGQPLPQEHAAGGAEEGTDTSSPYAMLVHGPMPGAGADGKLVGSALALLSVFLAKSKHRLLRIFLHLLQEPPCPKSSLSAEGSASQDGPPCRKVA